MGWLADTQSIGGRRFRFESGALRPLQFDLGVSRSRANARFTTPVSQCPVLCTDWESPLGFPIDIFVFGGRRANIVPLVHEAFDWDHGVFLGATAASETTTANIGSVGTLRRDPFAMVPFCGYNMGDYFQHWLDMGEKLGTKQPKIFYVNWFRKDEDGRWLWPGYGENSRVLKWVFERASGKGEAQETSIGYLPTINAIDRTGIDVTDEDMAELLEVKRDEWKKEIESIRDNYAKFGDRLPEELNKELAALEKRL